MALTNAERQKKFRESRKEKVTELELLRNASESLTSELNQLRNEHNLLIVDLKQLRNENTELKAEIDLLTKKLSEKRVRRSPYRDPYDENNSIFYVKDGKLTLLCWPETEGTIMRQGLELVPYVKIDRKFSKDMQKLISAANQSLRDNGLLAPDGA